MTSDALTLDVGQGRRGAALERISARWGRVAYAAAVGFVAMLYSNPMYWWPPLERLRLAFLCMAACAAAVIARRLSSGERLRIGGPMGAPLLAYLALFPTSLLWTIHAPSTAHAVAEAFKMAVVYVAVQNALDGPRRLRGFLLLGALATLGPALGGVWVWWRGDALVEGFRTHWRGLYGDPNRLAMSLVALLPAALYGVMTARRALHRALFALAVGAQLAAIVLTHSRSGAVAAAVAAGLYLVRGKRKAAQVAMAAVLLVGLVALAPRTFWARSATITEYETDVSVEGRRHAWMVLDGIVQDRPFTGVGGGAFLASWARYAPLEAGGHRYVAHNVLLETVGELGIPAFLLLCAFLALLLPRLWQAGADPLVGEEAKALFAGLSGYLVCEMANGYSLSWFMYFLFAASAAAVHLAVVRRRALGAGGAAA
jgi:O-antigen ligase